MKNISDTFHSETLDLWVYWGVRVAKDCAVLAMHGIASCVNGVHNTFAALVANQDENLRMGFDGREVATHLVRLSDRIQGTTVCFLRCFLRKGIRLFWPPRLARLRPVFPPHSLVRPICRLTQAERALNWDTSANQMTRRVSQCM